MRELFTFPTDTLLSDEREYLTIAINREEDGFTADKKQTKFDNLVKKGYRLIEEKHGKEVAEAIKHGFCKSELLAISEGEYYFLRDTR